MKEYNISADEILHWLDVYPHAPRRGVYVQYGTWMDETRVPIDPRELAVDQTVVVNGVPWVVRETRDEFISGIVYARLERVYESEIPLVQLAMSIDAVPVLLED